MMDCILNAAFLLALIGFAILIGIVLGYISCLTFHAVFKGKK